MRSIGLLPCLVCCSIASAGACTTAETDGSGGGASTGSGSVVASTSVGSSAAGPGSTAASTSTGNAVLPDLRWSASAFWAAPASAAPDAAEFLGTVHIEGLMGEMLPEGTVTLGNGLDTITLVPLTATDYQSSTNGLDYTGTVTFEIDVGGQQGFGTYDLELPWITDFDAPASANASEDIDLTWTPSPGATCEVVSSGGGGQYTSGALADTGQHTIPGGTLQPTGSQTLDLVCSKTPILMSTAVLQAAQSRRRTIELL